MRCSGKSGLSERLEMGTSEFVHLLYVHLEYAEIQVLC